MRHFGVKIPISIVRDRIRLFENFFVLRCFVNMGDKALFRCEKGVCEAADERTLKERR